MYVVELSVEVHTAQTHALSHLPCWELGLSSNNSNTAAQAHVMLSAAARTRLTKAIDGIGGDGNIAPVLVYIAVHGTMVVDVLDLVVICLVGGKREGTVHRAEAAI